MNTSDRDALVLGHLLLVSKVIALLHWRLPSRVHSRDIEQAGRIGLLEAASRFDPSRGDATFSTFARYRVMGAIFEECHKKGILTRSYRRRRAHSRIGPLELQWTPAMADWFPMEVSLEDVIARRHLRRALTLLPARERRIVTAFYLHGIDQETIGRHLGISPSRVQQLRVDALRRLRWLFQVDGVQSPAMHDRGTAKAEK